MVNDKLKVEIIGSTKPGFVLSKKDALTFGAHEAGICYMGETFEDIQNEDSSKTDFRKNLTLNNGHQSVYGHPSYNLLLTGIPKILAMILNNEKVYTTSEKSARYTKMNPTPKESELYAKWLPKFEKEISTKYPKIDSKKVTKLAQENARYLTSVFTPTTMGYTTDFRQLNYLMHWFDDFIHHKADTPFNKRLKVSMHQFNSQLKKFYVEELDPNAKSRYLSMFKTRLPDHPVFDVVYSVNYEGSFAHLAQAHRHRTINYQIKISSVAACPDEFFVPPILEHPVLKKSDLADEWYDDINSVAELFPQGTMLMINERGTVEDFVSKAYERLCGHAQLEIQNQTKKTLDLYLANTEGKVPEIHEILKPLANGPRCTFPSYDCTSACNFGKKALERLI
ncbi:FAD-dependent thymidylate synthase [Candidatus Woesearchaeota archaeon]|nr:FAD-dependent thymidylate synthase [Candidatus Woesearchaeota archaeon]